MSLPSDFHFSQGSLQDFVDCPRRFQLRYLDRIAWPAVQAEPILENERHLQQGELFHLMVQQHLVGVPVERLTAMAQGDADLAGWWQAYLDAAPAALPGQRFPEVTLSAPLGASGERRLVAKYDLVVLTPDGRAVIFDWKTSRHRPPRRWLAERLQTRVYPYLLLHAGVDLNGGRPLAPEQIEMVYWFAGFPDRPERFVYSADKRRRMKAPSHGAGGADCAAGRRRRHLAVDVARGALPLLRLSFAVRAWCGGWQSGRGGLPRLRARGRDRSGLRADCGGGVLGSEVQVFMEKCVVLLHIFDGIYVVG